MKQSALGVLSVLCPVTLIGTVFPACAAPKKMPAATSILDKDQQLARWDWRVNEDDDWFKANVPFWESPDTEIDKTYYYRWELVTRHMTYGSPQSGYSYTEFMNHPGWSGAYGSISCPMGLQMYEVRWLKDPHLSRDYAYYWFNTPGAQPRSYSNWFGDAIWATYLVNDDKNFVVSLLPAMEKQYQGWMQEHWRPEQSMFAWSSMHDGMEYTIASRQTANEFDGGSSYRPTLNSYVYGDLVAMAKTATLAGDRQKATDYQQKANALKKRVLDSLWDPKRNFFIGRFADDEAKDGIKIKANTLIYEDGKYAGSPYGRELSGYIPWQFHLPDSGKGYEVAWKGITDPDVFFAPHGLYFTERHDPLFLVAQKSCVWSGNNWPYADSQVLTAMANVLNDYPQQTIDKADYFKVFENYTLSQRENGKPYLAETSDPDTGRWTQDTPNMSEHYFHSNYNDLLITGLAGLRPRADNVLEVNPLAPDTWNYFALDGVAYHGHLLSIVWDKDGSRYGHGKGLTVWVDGKKAASSPKLGKLTAKLPAVSAVTATAVSRPLNFAVNNDGSFFPRVRASFIADGTKVSNLVDGNFVYDFPRPLNRWTTQGSPNASDWVEINFGTERPVDTVKVYPLDDGAGQPVRVPQSLELQWWDAVTSSWQSVPNVTRTPAVPTGRKPNIFSFPVLKASRLRLLMTPQAGSCLGLTEIEAWGVASLPLASAAVPADDMALNARVSASYTSKFDNIAEVNDGVIVMEGGRNRWTAFDSPNASDWLQFDWNAPQTLGRAEICFWGDNNVRLPKSYHLEYWDGTNWKPIEETGRDPQKATLGTSNEITFKPVQSTKLRIVFEHDLPSKTGVTEVLAYEK